MADDKRYTQGVVKPPSDVLENPKLAARATKVSHKKKGKRPKGFKATYRDAGDALAAASF
jgi:hypothetical protein